MPEPATPRWPQSPPSRDVLTLRRSRLGATLGTVAGLDRVSPWWVARPGRARVVAAGIRAQLVAQAGAAGIELPGRGFC